MKTAGTVDEEFECRKNEAFSNRNRSADRRTGHHLLDLKRYQRIRIITAAAAAALIASG